MDTKEPPIKRIFDIPFVSASKEGLLQIFIQTIERTSPREIRLVFTPNPEQVTRSFHDKDFLHALQSATWNLPDGQGVAWALNRKGEGEKGKGRTLQRIAGREMFHDLLETAKEKGWSVFLLGGRAGSAATIAQNFQKSGSSAFGIFYDPGAVDIAHETREEEARVLRAIRDAHPQLLFVAYGAPWQEHWLLRHKSELTKAGVRLGMVVGGAFDYEAGLVPLVPHWIERLHLEWLWRLLSEPWRWRRQLQGLEFFWRALTDTEY